MMTFLLAMLAGVDASAAVPSVFPEKTIRFPGSGCTSFATDGRVLYAVSAWTRENGAVVFDVSDPKNMRFTADLPAHGYSTTDPVLVGDFAYQPLWYGAMRVKLTDPKHPTYELVDFAWPKHTADRIVREGNELKFISKSGVITHDVSADLRSATPFTRDETVEFEYDRRRSSFRSFRRHGKTKEYIGERFVLHSLSSLAVAGDTAYIAAATQPRTTGLWTLDLKKDGFVDFGTNALFRPAPLKGTQNFTMLMQSVGGITDLGGGYLLADDGAVRLGAGGRMEFIGERERSVCNSAFEGTRVALAESDLIRVLDVREPERLREIARWALPVEDHATGIALEGDVLWAVVNEKPAHKLHHRNAFLGYVPPKSALRKYRIEGTNLAEIAAIDIPASVACVRLKDGFLLVSGMSAMSVVDGRAMRKVREIPLDGEGASYRVKRFGDRVFATAAHIGIKEYDWSDPSDPKVLRVFRRSGGANAAVDDFTVANGRLYALTHSALDVYDLATEAKPFRADGPQFALNFGAIEKGVAKLPDGSEAVAFGEGGLYIRKNRRYLGEVPPTKEGTFPFHGDEVSADGWTLTVIDRSDRLRITVDASDPANPRVVRKAWLDEAMIWPFPDRLSAYVWRNWTMVPKARLAEVIGAKPEDLVRIAAEMGLPDQVSVAPEWDTLGRTSIIRRNWNLVPHAQWRKLVPPDPDVHSNTDEGEDIVKWQFGGGDYPDLPELRYDADEAGATAAERREIAARLKREGVDMSDAGWHPFAFKRNLDRLTGVRSSMKEEDRRFALRFNCAYDGEWTDGLLEKNAAIGVNAIWVTGDFASVVKDPKYPELGLDAERRFAGWSELVEHAAKFGIRVFVLFNDPKQQPASFFAARPERAAIRGMPDRTGANYSLCTSTEEVRRWLEDGMASVFDAVPGLGGFILISASEARTNCASRRSERGKCERCKDRDPAEIFAEVFSTMCRGMRRASANGLGVCWDWGWNEDEALRAIPLLPKGEAFMAMSEKGLTTVTGGVTNEVREYAISRIGPSARAEREFAAAQAAGLKVIAKVQPGASWEFAAVPSIRALSLVREHAGRVAATEADGVMLSWTCGSYPSENLRIFCDWPKRWQVGAAHPDDRTSAAFRAYPYNGGTLYCGNQHMGPGNPLYPTPTGRLATMTGIPYDNLQRWVGNIPTNAWIEAMDTVAAGSNGLMALHFRSAADQARFVVARDAGDRAGMRRLAARELETAKAAMEELCRDSRNAYERANGYFYNLQDLREKILGCALIKEGKDGE